VIKERSTDPDEDEGRVGEVGVDGDSKRPVVPIRVHHRANVQHLDAELPNGRYNITSI
jgi:hypothetical protein